MNWYYSVEGSARGPVSEERLADLAVSGAVSTETLIWHPGLEEWEPVWKLKPEIISHLNKSAMASQAKGTTDRIPVADAVQTEAAAKEQGASPGIFSRLLGRLKRK